MRRCRFGEPIARRLGLALGAALLAAPVLALDPGKALTQYGLDLWETTEGLPQSSVFAICQTADGYLWLGTQSGLARFDGDRFVVFDARNTPGLGHSFVSAIVKDDGGTLWVGTVGGGLSRHRGGRFDAITVADGLPSDHVRAVAAGPAGSLWVGTDAGLARVAGDRITAITTKDGLVNDRVKALASGSDGTLWIGTDGGLQALRDGRFTTWSARDGLPDDRVLAVLPDRDGIFVGTQGGLGHLSAGRISKLTTADGLGNDVVIALHRDRQGSLWIGTYGGGISRLRDGKIETLGVGQGLSNEIVLSLYEDREGSLWVGTNGGGLHRFKDTKLTMVTPREGLSGDLILSIQEDPDGILWLGTAGSGLNRYDHGVVRHFTTADGLPSDIVFSTCRDRTGRLWIGTDAGLASMEGDRVTPVAAGGGPVPRRVRAIFEARDGTLWIGTDGDGLMRFDGRTFTRISTDQGLSHDVVSSIAEDAAGDLFVGTEVGLNRLQGGKTTSFATGDGLAADFVLTLYRDADGRLWVGTFGGLSLWADGRLRAFSTDDGLTDGPVGGIVEDARGNLWMSTNNGIFRVGKAELRDVAAGRRKAASPVWFGTGDGMKSAECNGGFQPAAVRARDGRIWFPTVKGAVVIDPENIPVNRLPPPVILERVLIDRVPAGETAGAEIVIPPGTEKLEFSYTAPSLLQTSRVRFKYLLEGYDRDWVDAGAERTAHYTSLPPRRYVFHVIACNDDGLWNETGAARALYLKPRYYETPWFWTLCALGLVAAALGVHRGRVRQLEARERHLSMLVAEKTRHLEIAIGELELRNEQLAELDTEKNEFLGIVAHDLKNPLNVIRGYAELLIEEDDIGADERKGLLGKVVMGAQRMLELITNLLDVNAIERGEMKYQLGPCDLAALAGQVVESYRRSAAGKEQTIHFAPPAGPAVVHADAGIAQQVCDNLVSNAVKYSPRGKNIWVRVLPADGKVRFEVQDEGPGISPEDLHKLFGKFAKLTARPTGGEHSSGLGLSIVKRLVEAMDGRVWCDSRPGAGATFVVELPVRPAAAAGASSGPTA